MLERLGTALSAVGHSGSTALLVLDVDHFAGVNARHGQSVGDEPAGRGRRPAGRGRGRACARRAG
ncbi:hypothetical protein GCM10025868_20430 [Angustibacter aerolatus]|uniref:GGDEF domain-containing protein n=1 Tax=Angustibacter aerolatus TaxID=1162965 RepID=A0ABQ6JHB7_9ACTN|nr:hypothetical protein GCM10025868_20430 [Angustibacter aerolatus]